MSTVTPEQGPTVIVVTYEQDPIMKDVQLIQARKIRPGARVVYDSRLDTVTAAGTEGGNTTLTFQDGSTETFGERVELFMLTPGADTEAPDEIAPGTAVDYTCEALGGSHHLAIVIGSEMTDQGRVYSIEVGYFRVPVLALARHVIALHETI